MTWTMNGVTRDSNGTILGGCTVLLFLTSTHAFVASTTSNAVTGAFSFAGLTDGASYFIVSIKAGFPDVFGTTDDTLNS